MVHVLSLGASYLLSPSGIELSRRASSIDCATVGALSLCALGVDCPTGGALFGLRAGVAWSVEIKFGITSSLIGIACDFVSIIRNCTTVFGQSFNRDSSAICWAAFLAVGGRST